MSKGIKTFAPIMGMIPCIEGDGGYVLSSDYSALKAEIAIYKGSLQSLNEQLAAKTECFMGVGNGSGNLFVHGDFESIKVCKEKISRMEKAEAELAELRERMKPVEEVYKEHEVWAREWLSTAPVSSRSRMLEFWQAICKTMEGK